MLKTILGGNTLIGLRKLGISALAALFFVSQGTLAAECTPLSRQFVHNVKSGETLGDILFAYNISPLWGPGRYVDLTARANFITSSTKLYPGQVLNIPLKCQEHVAESPRAVASVAAASTATVNEEPIAHLPPPAPLKLAEKTAASDIESSILSIDIIGKYSALHGTDTSNDTEARLISRFDPGVRLAWTQNWDEFVQTFIFAEFQNISLASERSGLPMKNGDIRKSGYGFGGRYALTDRVKLGGTIAQLPQIFYEGVPATAGLEFTAVPIWTFTPEISYLVAKGKKLSLSANLGATFYGSEAYADYRIQSGLGIQTGLTVRHQLSNGSDFRCSGFYGQRKQNTSLLELDEKFTGLSCGFGWQL